MSGRIVLGVAASVAGSLGHSLGMTLQKRAHMRIEALNSVSSSTRKRKSWKDSQWQAGLALYLFSSTVPPTIALTMLPVFVAAPLAAVGLVANAIFARYILASTFARTDAFGTLLVSLGSCCVAAFGAIDEPPLSLDELLLLYRRPAYVVFFSVYLVVVVALIIAELYWRWRYRLLGGDGSDCNGMDSQQSQRQYQQQQQQLASPFALAAPRVPLQTVSAPSNMFPRDGHFPIEEATPLLAAPTVIASTSSGESAVSSPPLSVQFYKSTETLLSSTTEQHFVHEHTNPSSYSNNNSSNSRLREEETHHTQPPASTNAVNDMYRRHFSETNEENMLPSEIKIGQGRLVARCASGFLSAVISGLICSQTLLLAKSGIGLLVLTLKGDMQFKDPLALAIVTGLICTALANLYYIQHALRLCSTLTVVPLCYCSSSLSALISSLVYFNQMRLLNALQVSMISVGIVLLAAGVGLLSSNAADEDGPMHLLPPESPED
ncbi:hypothetical protein GGI25_000821 [Coemansia spiralis]|uniref:Magnesium transporter n=2 Tax=Coemansia TaxID=4863 RepID=A0A9W8L029_9FUNG|nr:hypothetical protein EDC05_001813 [Coemansia umbellata]KAJ2623557.1 hypothetical protein GGI26_002195 [Coemansia sp. RSA 1358]KAJ2680228.1 hypothetical protein GGI25_000821 [Coemansia spiralis]